MAYNQWQLAEFGIISKRTGEIYDAELRIQKRRGSKFMKIWQDTGWTERISKLQGNSLKVLIYLLEVATWENRVPGTKGVAVGMGMKQPHVSKAYRELVRSDLLQKREDGYRLNHMFCWMGTDAQLQQVLALENKELLRIK